MNLDLAHSIAYRWKTRFEEVCERVEVAGSVRRAVEDVNDLDIVCVPRLVPERDIFEMETGRQVNLLEDFVNNRILDGLLRLHVDERGRLCNGPRHKKLVTLEEIKLELWIVLPPAQWGVQMVLRTGPKNFGHWLVTQREQGGALAPSFRFRDGAIWRDGGLIETPEEEDVFKILGLPWKEPGERTARWR